MDTVAAKPAISPNLSSFLTSKYLSADSGLAAERRFGSGENTCKQLKGLEMQIFVNFFQNL
jgi:hypothetical protein